MPLTCPDCKLDLAAVESASAAAHRCARCRGLWLDPASFQRICEGEARPPGEDAALVARPAPTRPAGPRPDDRVRYRPCPACGEVMNRSNFGRVSGVIIDVCRPHGAWLDRGELGAIRRFLREGGLGRYERRRRLERERQPAASPPGPIGARDPLYALYDLLFGGDGLVNLPSRTPRLPLAALFAILGGLALWAAFTTGGPGVELGLALALLYFAWRALRQWARRRR